MPHGVDAIAYRVSRMPGHLRAAAFLSFLILAAFAFSFWIGAQKPAAEGGIAHRGD